MVSKQVTNIALKHLKLLCLYLLSLDVVVVRGSENIDYASQMNEELYARLFESKRKEQVDAVKSLRSKLSFDKQQSMIAMMSEKIFSILKENRVLIESSSFISDTSIFPSDEKTRTVLSSILENTCLFGEIVLRYPDTAEKLLRSNHEWDELLQWCIALCNQVKHLLGKNTLIMLRLVSQELNHVERDQNYINPYRKQMRLETVPVVQKDKRKKKEVKRGPRFVEL